nr:MAG TPA: hypothetical protein [Caudoviricetes sp.]
MCSVKNKAENAIGIPAASFLCSFRFAFVKVYLVFCYQSILFPHKIFPLFALPKNMALYIYQIRNASKSFQPFCFRKKNKTAQKGGLMIRFKSVSSR